LSNEVKIIPGAHFPQVEEREVEIKRRHGWLTKWGLTALEVKMPDPPETVVTVTQMRPLPDGRERYKNLREASQFDGPERSASGETGPEEFPEAEGEVTKTSKRSTTVFQRCDSDQGGRRQVAGNRNPYHGTAPSVYQGKANANPSAEADEARGGN